MSEEILNPESDETMVNVEPTPETVTETPEQAPLGKAMEHEVRPVFTPDDKVEINASNVIILSNDIESVIKKHYNNFEDIDQTVSAIISGSVHDTEVALSKDMSLGYSNVIAYLDDEGNIRKTGMTAPKPLLNGSKLSGEEAVLAITSAMGKGGRTEIPLVNSGFRIQMRRITGDERVILDEQLLATKGDFGRMTIGSSMSFATSYLQRDIVNMALRTITATNLDGVEVKDISTLRKLISKRDYPLLIAGLLHGIHPDGILASVPCSSDDVSCSHVISGHVNVARMLFVDHSMLTESQLELITRGITQLVTKEEQAKYVEVLAGKDNTYSWVDESRGIEFKFTFKLPTLDEDIRSGMAWANNINKIVTQFMAGNSDDDYEVRKRIVRKQLQLNTISQFAGWIGKFEMYDNETKRLLLEVDDTATIIDTLKATYTEDSFIETLEAIRKFIFKTSPTVIGVPAFICPECKGTQQMDNYIVPVDIEKLFFIRAIDREMLKYHFDILELTQ